MTTQEYEFYELGPVWHLCSSGVHQSAIFRTKDELVYGMNMVALSAVNLIDEMKMLTFEVMSNHFHFVVACEEEVMDRFVNFLIKKLHRYLLLQERVSDMKGLSFKHFRITDVRHLQAVICYVNRNGYLVDKNSTPFSYPWGANSYFFNPIRELETSIDISELSISKIRSIFRCREYRLNGNLKFLPAQGYFSPASFCHIKLAENLFRDARHYFSSISRQIESYSQIARELGDSIFYTDEEIYAAIFSHCAKKYDMKNPSLLGKNDKFDVAKLMKYDYNASNAQIMRILKIDERILDELFPNVAVGKKK